MVLCGFSAMTSIEGKTIQAPVTKVMSSNPGWQVLRYLIAATLLVAAVSKSYMLSTTPTMGDGILDNRLFQIALVNFELALSVWLIAGLMPRFSWLVTIACFSVFAIVSFYKAAVLHESSCGCFGAVQVNPWITMTLDLAIIGLLIVFRPKGILFHWKAFLPAKLNGNLQLKSIGFFCLSWLLIAIPITVAILSFKPAFIELNGTVRGSGNVVILEPESWEGQIFPLFAYVRSNVDFSTGKWLIVFYEAKCDKCKKELQELEADSLSVLLLEVTGNTNNEIRHVFSTKPWFWGSLSHEKQWFIKTPTILEMNDGICVSVYAR